MKKTILITGGSEGLGKAIASKLASTCQVVILARSEENLKNTSKEIGCDFELCDISDATQIEKTVKKFTEKYGRIDALINNAALWIQDELEKNDASRIKEVVDVNTTGTMLVTKAVIPIMKKQKDGLIINIISQAGFNAKAERSVYTATKWAITGFTKSLQSELSKYGIRVTGLYPGKMKTGMFAKMGITKDMSEALDPAEVARVIEFLLETDPQVTFPEIGIKNILN